MINDVAKNEVRIENMGEDCHLMQCHQHDLTDVDDVAFEENTEEGKHIWGRAFQKDTCKHPKAGALWQVPGTRSGQ